MHYPLSIAIQGHVPKSILKSLQLASDGLLYTAYVPPSVKAGGGGRSIWWDQEPPEEREIRAYNENRDLLELAEMIIISGILD